MIRARVFCTPVCRKHSLLLAFRGHGGAEEQEEDQEVFGDVCALEKHLRVLDSTLESFHDHSHFLGVGKAKSIGIRYQTVYLLRSIIASQRLRDKHGLNKFVQEKVLPLLPDYARACVQECMDTVSWRVLVWSTRLQLCLDVSAMLCGRKALKDKPFVHYILADSSLQGDRDWLLHVSRQALQSSLPQIMQSVVQLTTDASRQARAVEDDEEGGDEPVLPSMPLDRADLFAAMSSSWQIRTGVPVALGMGRSSLEDKTAALINSICLEAGVDKLQFFDSVISVTTDMGVESQISEFNAINAEALLPTWVRAAVIVPDDSDGDVDVDAQDVHVEPSFSQ